MKISEAWLREWVDPKVDTQQLAEQLTMAGLEVDAIEPVAGEFTGVVVGEIVSVEQHPDADKLRVCQVKGQGSDIFQVVCGAPNARAGIKVPFAMVGATLPGDESGKEFKIKQAKLRGVESQGMLCAQTELHAGDDDSGLWELPPDAPIGEDLQKYLKLSDSVIEVDLTPNRGDCLSMRGIAREVGAINQQAVNLPKIEPVPATIKDAFPVELQAKDACPKFVGRVIRDIDINAPSPLWLQERLRRAGSRSIDCVVDVTNYLLLELGQPMHAYDLDKLQGKIVVRQSQAKEKVDLLDGQTLELNADTLLITDGRGPIGMAGIMGGATTAVSETTKNIFFESAFFAPTAILGKARSYGLHTDSSQRFERGVDYQQQAVAVERATRLLIDIAGGEPGPLVVVESPEHMPKPTEVYLRRQRVQKFLGVNIADEEIAQILHGLGIKKTKDNQDGWTFTAPSNRFDIAIEEDLLEELARIYGYNRLPTNNLQASASFSAQAEAKLSLPRLKNILVDRGYHEAITYSFVSPEINALFNPNDKAIALTNPLSADLAVMRSSLWAGLIQTLTHNVNRQQTRVRLFESGMRFLPDSEHPSGIKQEAMLAGLLYGSRTPESWAAKTEVVDFYDLKGDVEALLTATGNVSHFACEPGQHPALHPGQCAVITRKGASVGWLGALHPQIQRQLDLPQSVYLFELQQDAVLKAAVPKFTEISKFPEVRRDIAVVVDQKVGVGSLLSTAQKLGGETLQHLKVFDLYLGKGIETHRKSVALGLTFQHPSRTLNETEINASVESVVSGLKAAFDADLR
jgi:phenylalanyl-tRNA synthetase beta chain